MIAIVGDNVPSLLWQPNVWLGGWVGGSPISSSGKAQRLMDESQHAKRGPPNFDVATKASFTLTTYAKLLPSRSETFTNICRIASQHLASP